MCCRPPEQTAGGVIVAAPGVVGGGLINCEEGPLRCFLAVTISVYINLLVAFLIRNSNLPSKSC